MTTTMKPTTYTIDATGRTLGRVASEAASALLGKKSVHFMKNEILPVSVVVENVEKLSIPERRLGEKTYRHFTGHVGGLREITLPEMIAKKGIAYVFKQTVDGMIPRNKLRNGRMKNLVIKG